jgi:tetratricopeptide (TPR) repeat protein
MKRQIIICVYFLTILISNFALAQDPLLNLAQQYVESGDFDKAVTVYDQLYKNESNREKIFPGYYPLLLKFNRSKDAEKYLQYLIKVSSDPIPYQIEEILLHENLNGSEKTAKEWDKFYQSLARDRNQTLKASTLLLYKDQKTRAKELLLASRKKNNQPDLYAPELGVIYLKTNEYQKGIDEFLLAMENEPEKSEDYRNYLQNVLTSSEQMDLLENTLIDKVQKYPDKELYNDLIIWLYIQQKDFDRAFIQVKAFEKRNNFFRGSRLMELGQIAFENHDFEMALRIFQYVEKEYPNSPNYFTAKRYIIQTREEQIKKEYPVDRNKIYLLINDYKALTQGSALNNSVNSNEAKMSMALLYAFYLDKEDTAIAILEEIIAAATYDNRLKNKAKINLGDVYLLKGEPWESTLIYSQVEKDMKEDPLGHEAKLRNAKLYYYKGEFELAQEQLDVLKMATSREISNDAIELSLLIQDNTGLDTTTDAMQAYAAIDLSIFRHHYTEALSECDSLLKKFPGHSLTDEVYWLEYTVYRQIGKPLEALQQLEKINLSYSQDIWGDDALFYTGDLYEKELKDPAKAMAAYEKLLLNYPGSTYCVEARKRYRQLRGDKL